MDALTQMEQAIQAGGCSSQPTRQIAAELRAVVNAAAAVNPYNVLTQADLYAGWAAATAAIAAARATATAA